MPQDFYVLRCYSCSIFQVHIVKKVNKWQCKVCNEKQSVKKVYGEGSSKDCRSHVQRLNSLRATEEQTDGNVQVQQASALSSQDVGHQANCTEENYVDTSRETSCAASAAGSKWSHYLQPNPKEVSSEEENELLVPRFTNKQKTRRRKSLQQVEQSVDEQFQPSSSKWGRFNKQENINTVELQPQEDYTMSTKWKSYGEQSDWTQHNIQAKKFKVSEENSNWKSKEEDEINIWTDNVTISKNHKAQFVPENVEGSKWGKYVSASKIDNSDESENENIPVNDSANFIRESNSQVLYKTKVIECSQGNGNYSAVSSSCVTNTLSKPGLIDIADIADDELDELLNI